jgi:hypothetical protein
MTYETLTKILNEATNAATIAGRAKLVELQSRGPAYTVSNADLFTGKPVGPAIGTMLDLCGFAYCLIPKRVLSTRSKAVKTLIAERKLSNWSYEKALMVRLPHVDQAISVNVAMADAASDVLKSYGLNSYTTSRLD